MKTKTPITKCPKCGSGVWDNRANKKSDKAPDFKCKNEDCKDDKGYVTAWWLEDSAPPKSKNGAEKPATIPAYSWPELGLTYRKCHKVALWAMGNDMSPEALQAATATLFIQATRMGLKVTDPRDGYDDVPEALKEPFDAVPWDDK